MKALLIWCLFLMTANSQKTNQIEGTSIYICSNGTEESCDAFNSTELSTEDTTVEVSSPVAKKVTTKKPKAVPKLDTKITSIKNHSSLLQPQPECTCDLTRGGCEVNCCCDVDCNEEQRAVFTKCIAMAAVIDTDYCIPPHLLLRNNSDHQTVMSDGMLCVVTNNTHVAKGYRDVPVVRTLTVLKSKLEKHKYYSWSNSQTTKPIFDTDVPYKDGSPVWISQNNTITHLAFPASGGYSSQCLTSLTPKYLVDVDISCTVPFQNQIDCLTSFNTNFSVISSPRNFNFTGPQECTDDVCLPIRQFICTKTCVEGKVPLTRFNDTNRVCLNVVLSVEYKIYHNGSQGIVEMKAFYTLSNLSVEEDKLIRKHYRVTYKWGGTDGEVSLKRSGHPGYERGKPVISGRRTTKTVVFNSSETEWISFPVAGSSSGCESRYNLRFGENVKSQCVMRVSGTCKQIQQQLWRQMLGPGDVSEIVISAFGDPRLGDEDAWVPLFTSDLPPPPTLVSAVDIVILHTLVGPIGKPATKIIGAYLHVLPSEVVCAANLSEVAVQVSVRFIDKTVAPVTKFAPPPVYEIKLPQDFFYPFLSSGGEKCSRGRLIVMVCLVGWFSSLGI